MLLPWLILIPFIGGVLCWQSERFNQRAPRYLALLVMGLTLLLSVLLWLQGDFSLTNTLTLPEWQTIFFMPWITPLGINIALAIDGLSLLMIVLTAIMGIFSVLSSWSKNQPNQGAYHFHLMWILGGVMGIFLAVDLFLFFFFWEMMLIPMYFLIANWGHKGSEERAHVNAATKFFIYTQASGLIMLLAIIALALIHYQSTGNWSFAYHDLLNTKMSSLTQYLLMMGFFIAFAVKMPVVPFHGWMADTQEQSPTAGSVDISGIMLKTAAYGLLRFTLPLFPEASIQFTPVAMTLGVISIFYGAWLAFKQTDIKRLVAYSSLSHMGFVTVAIYAGSFLAYQGVVLQMIDNGLSGAALIIISGQLYERIGTRDMRMMGGLWKRIMWLPALSLFFAMATLGMPGTGNFVGEFMILFGTLGQFKLATAIMVFGVVFASIYALWMMQQVYYGSAKSEKVLPALNGREIVVLLTLALLLVALGFYPQPLLDTSKNVMESLHDLYSISFSALRPQFVMTITFEQLIALSPLLIVGLLVVIVMLSIAWQRLHLFNATLTLVGFTIALLTCFLIGEKLPLEVTPLIYVDKYSLFYSSLILLAGIGTVIYGYEWLTGYPDNKEEFYLLLSIAVAGGILLSMANHLATLFIGIELISLPLFGLVGYAFTQKRSLEASIKYMLLSAAASAFLLFGMALLYAESGSLLFAKLGLSLNEHIIHYTVIMVGVGMMLVGIGFKLSFVPFQLWTPDVYQGAPAPVATFLATASKIALFAALMRLLMTSPIAESQALLLVLSIIAIASILFGNLIAISQQSIKRLLGYSSIAYMGYLLLPLIALQTDSVAAQITVAIYFMGYLLVSLGAFGVVSMLSSPYSGDDKDNINAYRGLYWRQPILAIILTIVILSLAGIPITLGFIGKFYLIITAINAELWWLTAVVIIGSAMGLYYYLRFMASLYSRESLVNGQSHKPLNVNLATLFALLCAVITILLGIWPPPMFDIVLAALAA